jgi:7-cyano-7-deazaguanine synthase in queuosine biosynthesis
MNMVTSLMNGAKSILKDVPVTETLCEAAFFLEACYDNLKGRLDDSAEKESLEFMDIDFKAADLLSLPDAVWRAICLRRPQVYNYPLGEITERAVKKAVNSISYRDAPYPYDDVDPSAVAKDNKIREKLKDFMNSTCKEKMLQIFITHYFFEICIDQLRRPSNGNKNDWCYRYHFSRKGKAVSWESEKRSRRTLTYQCARKAELFLEYLKNAVKIKSTNPDKARKEIRKGFIKIFKLYLPFSEGGFKAPGVPFINAAVGNNLKLIDPQKRKYELMLGRKPLSSYKAGYDISGNCRNLLFGHEQANVGIPYVELEEFLGKKMQPLVKDLLEIGTAVYISDLHTKRQKDLNRKIGLLMPLRNPDAWKAVRNEMERAVSFLGRDRFSIHPVRHSERAAKFEKSAEQSDKDCVCLFSGGLDSTAGAVWALENGLRPLFVSHYSNHRLGSIQKTVIRRLYEIYHRQMLSMRITKQTLANLNRLSVPKNIVSSLEKLEGQRFVGDADIWNILGETINTAQALRYRTVILKYSRELQHVGFFVSKPKNTVTNPDKVWRPLGGSLQSVMAQHLRSFLFLSLAAAVALELGIKKIFVFENGPVALNPLFSEARVNTRTTHLHFLWFFEDLIKKVFDVELCIENPFLYMSKGEVARILAKPRLRGLVALTDSCWNWFKVPLVAKNENFNWCRETHDGECIPCIIRRAAVQRAGLYDEDTSYLTDVFNEYPHLNVDIIKMVADYIRFCYNVNALKDQELLHYAPDFSVYGNGVDCQKLIKMYRKHAGEIVECFRARANKSFKDDFATLIY